MDLVTELSYSKIEHHIYLQLSLSAVYASFFFLSSSFLCKRMGMGAIDNSICFPIGFRKLTLCRMQNGVRCPRASS